MARAQGRRPQRLPPVRSCVACRQPRPKRELLRIVRTATGTVEVDRTGRQAGRGAYLCRDRTCWEAGLRGNAVEHGLRLLERLPSEVRDRLLQEGLSLTVPAPISTPSPGQAA